MNGRDGIGQHWQSKESFSFNNFLTHKTEMRHYKLAKKTLVEFMKNDDELTGKLKNISHEELFVFFKEDRMMGELGYAWAEDISLGWKPFKKLLKLCKEQGEEVKEAHVIANWGGDYGGKWSYEFVKDTRSYTCGYAMKLRADITGKAYSDLTVHGPFRTKKEAMVEVEKRNAKRRQSISDDQGY